MTTGIGSAAWSGSPVVFVDGGFWANNSGQRGVISVGPCTSLAAVKTVPLAGYSTFNVPVTAGNCYVALTHNEEHQNIVFRVEEFTGPTTQLTWKLVDLEIENCTGTTRLSNNDFIGGIAGFTQSAYPDNRYTPTRPAGTQVRVRPNKYDPSRAHVAIFNWDNLDSVPVDVSNVLAAGDAFEVIDVQDLFGAPVLRGVYAGGPLAVPMTHTAVTAPVGNVPVTLAHTSKEFGAFLIRKACR